MQTFPASTTKQKDVLKQWMSKQWPVGEGEKNQTKTAQDVLQSANERKGKGPSLADGSIFFKPPWFKKHNNTTKNTSATSCDVALVFASSLLQR